MTETELQFSTPLPQRNAEQNTATCCRHPNYHYRDGFLVCINCGNTEPEVEELVSVPPRIFDNIQKITRQFHEIDTREPGMAATVINPKEAKSDYVNFVRYSRLNNYLPSGSCRTTVFTIRNYEFRICEGLYLPDHVATFIKQIFRRVCMAGFTAGRYSIVTYAACVLYGIRKHNLSILDTEISDILRIPNNMMHTYCRLMCSKFGLLPKITLHLSPERYIDIYCGRNEVAPEFTEFAKRITTLCTFRSGHSPKSLAAAALYVAFKSRGMKRTQDELSDFFGITQVSLRMNYHAIEREYHRRRGKKQ